MPNAIDLFDDATDDADTSSTQPTADTATSEAVVTSESDAGTPDADSATEQREILDAVPDGAMNAGDFAKYITSVQYRKAFEAGDTSFNPEHQVIPQAVYQATQRKNNPMPFVMVKDSDGEPRKWILVAQAEEWWFNRPTSEGSSGPGSARTAEDESRLLKQAYAGPNGYLYCKARADEWADRAAKKNTLVEKRVSWLAALGGDPEAVKAEAAEEFKTEQAEKAAAKAASKESAEEAKPSDA